MKKKRVLVIVAVICICALVFGIAWAATGDARYRNYEIKEITEQIAEMRAGNRSILSFLLNDDLAYDEKFQDFLVAQVQEMYQNKEYELLTEFLEEIEYNDIYCSQVVDTLNNCLISSENLVEPLTAIGSNLLTLDYYGELSFFSMLGERLASDEAYQQFLVDQIHELCQGKEYDCLKYFLRESEEINIKSELISDTLADCLASCKTIEGAWELSQVAIGLDYYDKSLSLNKNNGIVAAYINEHGVNPITFTEGEGYYAGEANSSWDKRVGISGSKLHNAKETTYMGDFECVYKHGTNLNYDTYTEESYAHRQYYFRDNAITFYPDDGECVWSGDYLFCFAPEDSWFDSEGDLRDFTKLK